VSTPSPPAPFNRYEQAGLCTLLFTYAALFSSNILASPHGTMADEEAEVPLLAEFLASGLPLNELPRMQYMPFCGGCTAEALIAWPAFELLGSALWVWKLIPLAFGLLLMASIVAVGRRASAWTGLLAGGLLLLAPPFVVSNSTQAFGSHFEASAIVMLALWLALRWRERPSTGRAGALGLVVGAGFWFSYSTAFAVPVVLAVGLAGRPGPGAGKRALAAAVCGGVGFAPWVWTRKFRIDAGLVLGDSWLPVFADGLGGSSPEGMLAKRAELLVGELWWASIWPGTHGELAGQLWAGAELLCLVGLAVVGLSRLRRSGPGTPFVEGSVLLLLLCFVAVFLAMAPPVPGDQTAPLAPNTLRYLLPAMPLLALGFGLCAGSLASQSWVGRALAVCFLGVVAVPGIAARRAEVDRSDWTARALHLPAATPELGFAHFVWRPAPFLGSLPGASDPARMPPPQRPLALRSYAYSVGGFGEGLPEPGMGPGDTERALSRWLDEQPAVVRRTALMGYVYTWPALVAADPRTELGHEALALLGPFDPPTRLELLEVSATFVPLHPQTPDIAQPENTLERLVPATLPDEQRPAAAWALGYLVGRELFLARSLPDALDTVDVASKAFDGEVAGHAWRGFSDAFGRRWGYSKAARESFLADVPTEHRPDAVSGLEQGTRWAFVPGTWRE
jgi:hypothetical protein